MEGNTDEQMEKKAAELKEKFGLQTKETPTNPLFQGDWGHSIDFYTLIPILIFLLVGAILLFRFIYKKKNKSLLK